MGLGDVQDTVFVDDTGIYGCNKKMLWDWGINSDWKPGAEYSSGMVSVIIITPSTVVFADTVSGQVENGVQYLLMEALK